jgi:hypothetical protein
VSNPLITEAQAAAHLRIEPPAAGTPPAADLTLKIQQASDVIADYLKAKADPVWDATTAPPLVQAAVLYFLAHLYEHRGDDLETVDPAVWSGIERALMRSRDPALA